MMFGRPPAPQVNWEEMYFYQKLHHLFDHGADWMISKVNWWIPSVAAGMALSLLLLSENPVAEGAAITMPTFSPVVRAPIFGLQLPEREGAPPEEDDEDGNEELVF
ncbi:putative variant surface glycoprotein [Trypanosoma conorhini]|uniref:Putative variant surface glycoprotein n=1 Tax=Trypanosoma conorhini TaxID=83891 RepID=A0A422PD24_9TRYP|nr:putative variant surface glycoprotein [Trypanosoma conorhini]RNF15608.1 putative variant surface glycoprotein [Trypanosoma conorhini]